MVGVALPPNLDAQTLQDIFDFVVDPEFLILAPPVHSWWFPISCQRVVKAWHTQCCFSLLRRSPLACTLVGRGAHSRQSTCAPDRGVVHFPRCRSFGSSCLRVEEAARRFRRRQRRRIDTAEALRSGDRAAATWPRLYGKPALVKHSSWKIRSNGMTLTE